MRRIWDAIGVIIITVFALWMLFSMIRPYVPFIIGAVVLYTVGAKAYQKARRY